MNKKQQNEIKAAEAELAEAQKQIAAAQAKLERVRNRGDKWVLSSGRNRPYCCSSVCGIYHIDKADSFKTNKQMWTLDNRVRFLLLLQHMANDMNEPGGPITHAVSYVGGKKAFKEAWSTSDDVKAVCLIFTKKAAKEAVRQLNEYDHLAEWGVDVDLL